MFNRFNINVKHWIVSLPWPSIRKDQRGFTLIEAVVATFIAGTVVVGSIVVMGTAVRTASSTSGNLDLQQLVQTQLETIQQVPYSLEGNYPLLTDLPPGTTLSFVTSDSGTNYRFPNPDGTFVLNVVQRIDVTAQDEVSKVTMSVYKIEVP